MSITGHTEGPASPGPLADFPAPAERRASSDAIASGGGSNGSSGTERRTDVAEIDDQHLLALVRAGEDAAFAELFSRHARAVRGYALRYSSDTTEAEDIAAEAFFRVLQAVRRGHGPEGNVRGYLLTVVRRLAAEWRTRHRDVPTADEELSRRVDPDEDRTAGRAEAHLIARAFTTLPDRWRTVLWQVDVQGERPAVVARHFGLSPNATAALARRAREGLRAAYLQAHVSPTASESGCRTVVDRLGAYTAGSLRAAECRRITAHLAGCAACRALHDELADVCAGLRRHAGLLIPPVVGGAVLAGHRLLLGRLFGGKAAGAVAKAAAVGTRAKLVLAATSVVAVGGMGVAAGPVVAHLLPDHTVDRDQGLRIQPGPLLPNLSSGSAGTVISGRLRSPLRPATSDDQLWPPQQGSRTSQITGPSTSHQDGTGTGPDAGTDAGAGGAGTVTPTSGPQLQTMSAAHRPTAPVQSSSTTDDPTVTQTSDPPPRGTDDPTTDPDTTVWSTVWTTDGTTIWETVWRSNPPSR